MASKSQEDTYVPLADRIKSNLFIKAEASNTDCFVGEPIIVSYKLYSALSSESSIIKNPSFPNFSVEDILQPDKEIASRETVDGVVFDVHTLLKLKLTPNIEGQFNLGTLVVANKIRLEENGKKDALLDGIKESYKLNNGYYTINISSLPVAILVTALPQSTNASTYDKQDPVGDYKMDVLVSKKILAVGERDTLQIVIMGTGDFDKIKQPVIEWPDGITAGNATTDKDDVKSDGSGYLSFNIPFVAEKAGKYTVPSVEFSFFDALTGKYKTITNLPIEVTVGGEGMPIGSAETFTNENTDNRNILIIGSIAIISIALLLLFFYKRKKRNKSNATKRNLHDHKATHTVATFKSAEQIFSPLENLIHTDGADFFVALKKTFIGCLQQKYDLPPDLLTEKELRKKGVPETNQKEIAAFISNLDRHIYSGGMLNSDRQMLLTNAKEIINKY